MSLLMDGKEVRCDGPGPMGDGCGSFALVPVALRCQLAPTPEDAQAIAGWLFVKHGETFRHYCPCCVPAYLRGLVGPPALYPLLITER